MRSKHPTRVAPRGKNLVPLQWQSFASRRGFLFFCGPIGRRLPAYHPVGICLGVKRLDRLTKDLLSLAAVSAVVFLWAVDCGQDGGGIFVQLSVSHFPCGERAVRVSYLLPRCRDALQRAARVFLAAGASARACFASFLGDVPALCPGGLLGAWIGGRGRKKGP